MRLAVVIPSRGLIHSRTIAAVHREADATGWEWRIFFAHGRPIPECFNEPIAEALRWRPTKVWLVEEDMHLPHGILNDLILAGEPVTAADYDAGGHPTVYRAPDGSVLWAGTGCLLASPDALKAHPFTTGHHYEQRHGAWAKIPGPSGYGGHDVNLGMALHDAGTPIHVIGTRCAQYRITRTAATGTNTLGWHDIDTV